MRLADIEVGKVFRTESTGILTSTSLWNLWFIGQSKPVFIKER